MMNSIGDRGLLVNSVQKLLQSIQISIQLFASLDYVG